MKKLAILTMSIIIFGQTFEGTSPAKKVEIHPKGWKPAEEIFQEMEEESAPSVKPYPYSDVDKNIPRSKIKTHDGVAIIIAISEYQNPDVPDVDFALNDAFAMRDYLTKTLGFKEENILFEINENATQAAFKRIFEAQLNNFVMPDGSSEVFVFYSGHGAPDPESKKAFFVPYDCDPSYAKQTGYSLDEFYGSLNRINAKHITVVLDACFSGASEKGNLLGEISPIFITVEGPQAILENGTVFSSSSGEQVSSWHAEEAHGLFTYFFLKGLSGDADANRNKKITALELGDYLEEKVPYLARRMHNREQMPQRLGNQPDKILVKY
ncbi:MAG: caspase family protein [Candidatus Marinimicrobia bacterium]|nr:caspase family protein [Candidatus Neomarinimicrobiota bacterium]